MKVCLHRKRLEKNSFSFARVFPNVSGARKAAHHGDERRGGETDLFGGLRDPIRPREPLKCGGKTGKTDRGRSRRRRLGMHR
jgi:hypothetical protein